MQHTECLWCVSIQYQTLVQFTCTGVTTLVCLCLEICFLNMLIVKKKKKKKKLTAESLAVDTSWLISILNCWTWGGGCFGWRKKKPQWQSCSTVYTVVLKLIVCSFSGLASGARDNPPSVLHQLDVLMKHSEL